MTVRHVTVDKPLFKLGMTLGEGEWKRRANLPTEADAKGALWVQAFIRS